MRILLAYLKNFKWLILLALILAAINQTFSLLDPVILGKIIDQYATHPHEKWITDAAGKVIRKIPRPDGDFTRGVLLWLGAAIGVAMVSRIAKAFQDYFVNVIIQKFGAKLFTDGLRHSMQLPYQDFEDQRSGETLSILTKARADCEKFITSFVNVLFTAAIGIVFVTIYSLRLDWRIVALFFTGSFFLAWLTSWLSKKIKIIQRHIVNETTALAGATTESLRNIELVKSLGLTDQEIDRLNKNTYKILGLELTKVKRIRSLSFIQGTFVNFLRQCIMFTLLWLIFRDVLQVGQMMTLQFFSFFIFNPLQELGNIIMSYREAEASLQNFDTLMKKPKESKPLQPRSFGDITRLSFEQVSFRHLTAQHKALNKISFTAEAGETIALVGPSGSGKTTLAKLLVGLYHPGEGRILYNRISSRDIDFDALRRQIGYVTQDTQLFAGTIRENLVFVRPDATNEQILAALNDASCQYILSRAEKGIHTVIGEGGMKISGGERQRLSIARALLRDPRLLIFDEATSSLDSITEEAITDTIKKISSRRKQITVLIAHRLSTIMHADRIYVLERGDIVETGTHSELVREKGLYYAMWRQQIGERKSDPAPAADGIAV
ncbi:ABC transporter ATP-binding protein [Compostibacter hankyongensis]|uniref:ABC transporter ATP-binding protein n=1 Tax=Compostibacter hankyongensis TaxID=1007089 RepID=A0ABP8G820_9BACT